MPPKTNLLDSLESRGAAGSTIGQLAHFTSSAQPCCPATPLWQAIIPVLAGQATQAAPLMLRASTQLALSCFIEQHQHVLTVQWLSSQKQAWQTCPRICMLVSASAHCTERMSPWLQDISRTTLHSGTTQNPGVGSTSKACGTYPPRRATRHGPRHILCTSCAAMA